MPIVIADQIRRKHVMYNYDNDIYEDLFLLDAGEIATSYEHFCIEDTVVNGYISRVFNKELEAIMEPRLFVSLDLMKASLKNGSSREIGYYLNFDSLAKELSIPDGYYVEVLLTSLENEEYDEKILFPHELKVATSLSKLKNIIDERIEPVSYTHLTLPTN